MFSTISCFGYQCGLAVFGFARTRRRSLKNRAQEATGTTHTYYIAADEVDWNYAPAEMDHMTGQPYNDHATGFS